MPNDTDKRERVLLDDWAKLHIDWYNDGVLRAAAQMEPACFRLWPVLMAMSKAQSHAETNPGGVITINLGDLAAAILATVDETHRALDTLVEGEMISYEAGRLQTLRISLSRWTKWQTPRKSKRQRDERSRSGASRAGVFVLEGDGSATQERQSRDGSATIDRDRDRDRKGTRDALPSVLTIACENAATSGIDPKWWTTSINKHRNANPDIPDAVLAKAIDDVIGKATGPLTPSRAYSMLGGFVSQAVTNHRAAAVEAAKPVKPKTRRTFAAVNAIPAELEAGAPNV